jgi:hypothetical protein
MCLAAMSVRKEDQRCDVMLEIKVLGAQCEELYSRKKWYILGRFYSFVSKQSNAVVEDEIRS